MEHRQQMWALKRTHLFPDLGDGRVGGLEKKRDINVDELNQNPELRRLARAFGLHPEELVDEIRRNPARSAPPAHGHLLPPDAADQRRR